MNMLVLHCISSFEGTSYKKLQDIATSSFIYCCLASVFTLVDIIFFNFSELDSKLLSKKYFYHEFSFLNRFTQTPVVLSPSPTPYSLNDQNPLQM